MCGEILIPAKALPTRGAFFVQSVMGSLENGKFCRLKRYLTNQSGCVTD